MCMFEQTFDEAKYAFYAIGCDATTLDILSSLVIDDKVLIIKLLQPSIGRVFICYDCRI